MFTLELFVVRRCDGFYRVWHDVSNPTPMRQAQALLNRLTKGGTQSTGPDDFEYYEIFPVDPLPGWRVGDRPMLRRLYKHDAPAIEAHLLGLDAHDRHLRFFREATDTQICAYVRGIVWDFSVLVGAITADRIVGVAEALLDRSAPPRHAEIAVSVDSDRRGQGLGCCLVANAVDRARILGASQTSLTFLRENRSIQRIVRTLGGRVDMEDLVGVIPIHASAEAEE